MKKPPRNDGDEHYEVGYRRPPKHSRFQKGRSGNPKGRPKGAKDLQSSILEELRKTVVVREGERTRRVNKLLALFMAVMKRGFAGDNRAAGLAMSTAIRLDEENPSDKGPQTFADLMRLATEGKREREAAADAQRTSDGESE